MNLVLLAAESVEVTLAAGTTDTVEFATSSADSVGTFSISCVTALATDENTSNDTLSDTVVVRPGSGIQEQGKLPVVFALDRARPTPFTGRTTIRFSIPRTTQTSVCIYSATGALVRVLSSSSSLAPNTYSLTWDGRDNAGAAVPRGVYYCRMAAGGFRDIQKLVKLE